MARVLKVEGYPTGRKRPAPNQITREPLLQQLREDQERSVRPDTSSKFQSLPDAVQRLLPYHVFQGSLPSDEDMKKVDNEFETAATHLLQKTQTLMNKYHRLLLEDSMRINPSAETIMLDRMFIQEERDNLNAEKRMAYQRWCTEQYFYMAPSMKKRRFQ